ncbi:MAG: preprotein translocase subunit SecY [Fimbriimonadaceae bacterium]
MFGGGGDIGGKGLKLPLTETLRLAWADPDLRAKILFVLAMFGVFSFGVHIPVPIPGVKPEEVFESLKGIPFFQLLDVFGGGAIRRLSVLALGLNPYITSSIIMQILQTAIPQWKKDLQEGGEYARREHNRRIRLLTLVLCFFQGWGLLSMMANVLPITTGARVMVCIFWTAGAMFMLWLGEQITERGIGNGVSLMIFAGIIISLPNQVHQIWLRIEEGTMVWYQAVLLALIFLATTWFIVLFTTAQRRIPIQHMRRMIGTKSLGGQTSYLPLSVNMAGVIPIIFAVSLIYMPGQFASMFRPDTPIHNVLSGIQEYLNPGSPSIKGLIGCALYTVLIFFFTYFYTAVQYNVEDIANNLKRAGSFIPGVRPGKQTKEFLDGVISRITFVGAAFLSIVALMQYVGPMIVEFLSPATTTAQGIYLVSGTSLLIVVSVALETMRQIEANLLMRNYGG